MAVTLRTPGGARAVVTEEVAAALGWPAYEAPAKAKTPAKAKAADEAPKKAPARRTRKASASAD